MRQVLKIKTNKVRSSLSIVCLGFSGFTEEMMLFTMASKDEDLTADWMAGIPELKKGQNIS